MNFKVLFLLSSNRNKASSRVRGYWIAEELEMLGCNCTLIADNSKTNILKLFTYSFKYDVIIFQKTYSRYHLLLLLWLKCLGRKVYLDIDDAPSIVNRKQTLKNFSCMVKFATNVFCGSKNLMELVNSIKHDCALYIPTALKIDNYQPAHKSNRKICIGWIGNGKHYYKDLIELLQVPLQVLSQRHSIRLKLIGTCGVESLYRVFGEIDDLELDFIEQLDWSRDEVVGMALRDIDIGVYPLVNNDFNSFKCGFKALEYMAMEIPVVSSPISVNKDIIIDGENGFLASSTQDWIVSLEKLIINEEIRVLFGNNGRKKIINEYSSKHSAELMLKSIIK